MVLGCFSQIEENFGKRVPIVKLMQIDINLTTNVQIFVDLKIACSKNIDCSSKECHFHEYFRPFTLLPTQSFVEFPIYFPSTSSTSKTAHTLQKI